MAEERTHADDIDDLLAQTRSEDAKERAAAARTLCPCRVKFNEPAVWSRLIELASDPDVTVRRQVFHTLGDGSPNERHAEVLAAMQAMYHDPDKKLRRAVRQLLAQYKRTGKINIL